MLAYAPQSRRSASPRTLAIVIAGHAALLAVVLTARGELPGVKRFDPTKIIFVDPVEPPPPPPPADIPRTEVRSRVDTPAAIIPIPQPPTDALDRGPPIADPTPLPGPIVEPLPQPGRVDPPLPAVVRKAARFVTAPDDIRPPYPEAKRRLEEEATLKLALEIDARGRVIAVTPVGAADPLFLDAARRHMLRRWRYQPATEDGVAVPARLVVTLKFELDE